MKESETYILIRSLFELLYSFARQYSSWYEKNIRDKIHEKKEG
jgi:hypothetical protein